VLLSGVAVHKCDAIIVLLTDKYVGSPYCRNELFLAFSEQKQVVPVVFEGNVESRTDSDWDG